MIRIKKLRKRIKARPPTKARSNFQLLDTKLIWIQDRMLVKSRKINAVTVEDIPVWLVRQGGLELVMGQEKLTAKTGQWMFPQQGKGHVYTMPNSKILSFRFRLRWPNGQEVYRRKKTLILDLEDWPELNHTANRLLGHLRGENTWFAQQWKPTQCVDYFDMQAPFQRWLAAYGRIMEAHGQTQSSIDEADVPALEARKVLMDWNLTRPFSRIKLSRELGVSVQAVTRCFTDYFNITPRAFLEQRKLGWARERLGQSQERIKVIAAELGFISLAQFSNWFRLHNYLSPRDYRKFTQEGYG